MTLGANTDHLTKNQSLVMKALEAANGPLTAYSLLDKLRADGFRAPLQVYRALDKLVSFGLVHRLESINAFVACQHPHCSSQALIAFMICDKCGDVSEINDPALSGHLKLLADNAAFEMTKTTVELRGACQTCAD